MHTYGTESKTNTKTRAPKSSKCGECCGCFLIILGVLIVLSIVGAAIYHIYLDISGLSGVSNSKIRALCNSSAINESSSYTYEGSDPSEIWMYVLVSLIFVKTTIANSINNNLNKEEEVQHSPATILCSLNCLGAFYGIFCGWGWDQIWNSGTCLEYNFGDETLLLTAKIHVYIQAFLCGLILTIDVIFLLVVFYEWCCTKKTTPTQRPTQRPTQTPTQIQTITST